MKPTAAVQHAWAIFLLALVLVNVPQQRLGGQTRKVSARLNDALIQAIRDDDAAKVKALLARGASVRTKDEHGWTPLMFAGSFASKEVVARLLQAGADVNARSTDGLTPLWTAASGGQIDVVTLLLDRGAKVNAVTNSGAAAFVIAAGSGYLDIVKLLLARGTNLRQQGDKAMEEATLHDRFSVIRYLLDKGVPIDKTRSAQYYGNAIDTGWSVLMNLIQIHDAKGAAFLIANGADVHVKSKNGVTPLKLAEENQMADIVELLKKAGATE